MLLRSVAEGAALGAAVGAVVGAAAGAAVGAAVDAAAGAAVGAAWGAAAFAALGAVGGAADHPEECVRAAVALVSSVFYVPYWVVAVLVSKDHGWEGWLRRYSTEHHPLNLFIIGSLYPVFFLTAASIGLLASTTSEPGV